MVDLKRSAPRVGRLDVFGILGLRLKHGEITFLFGHGARDLTATIVPLSQKKPRAQFLYRVFPRGATSRVFRVTKIRADSQP